MRFEEVRHCQTEMDCNRAKRCLRNTLRKARWLHAEAWREACALIGIHVNVETLRRQIGKGGNELIPVFVPWWKQEQVNMPHKAYKEHIFRQDYLPKAEALPRAKEFLMRLKDAGIRPTLASSANKEDLSNYEKIVGMERLFDEESSADKAIELICSGVA